jgi:hypothetical protein
MRLHLILPRVEPSVIILPSTCPCKDCEGTHFQHHPSKPSERLYRQPAWPRYVAEFILSLSKDSHSAGAGSGSF